MDGFSLLLALVTTVFGILLASQPGSPELLTLLFPAPTAWFLYHAFVPHKVGRPTYVLKLGGVIWKEADFCRGWEIDGRTGSGKTASGVVPIVYALKCNRPEVGIMALDTKGDLSEPLESIAKELQCERDLRQLEVRPDDAPPNWKPKYTLNMLADSSIPYSTYAKMLVDVATAAGQKGGQAFFKNAAQTAIQNAMATLAALDEPVTIENCFRVVTDANVLSKKTPLLENHEDPTLVTCAITTASSTSSLPNKRAASFRPSSITFSPTPRRTSRKSSAQPTQPSTSRKSTAAGSSR
jgi:hypothetical protein